MLGFPLNCMKKWPIRTERCIIRIHFMTESTHNKTRRHMHISIIAIVEFLMSRSPFPNTFKICSLLYRVNQNMSITNCIKFAFFFKMINFYNIRPPAPNGFCKVCFTIAFQKSYNYVMI